MKKNNIFCLLSVVLFSCTEVDHSMDILGSTDIVVLSEDESVALRVSQKGTLVSGDEALQKANAFLQGKMPVAKSGQAQNLTCKTLWVKYVSMIKSTKSMNTAVDSIPLYLINQENGKSVLVSGDERIPKILAYSDQTLCLDKTGTAVDVFIERLPAFISETIDEFNLKYDSLLCNVNEKIGVNAAENSSSLKSERLIPLNRIETETTPWQEVYNYAPLINVTWGQGYPYNISIAKINCGGSLVNPPTGCAAVATVQILSFHKYPSIVDGNNLNWVEITREPKASDLSYTYVNQIAKLMSWTATGINTTFGCEGSESDILKVKNYLNQIGYNSDNIVGYDKDRVVSSIQNSRPLYARGTSTLGGHAWVIDGANKRNQTIIEQIYEYKGSNQRPADPIDPSEWRLKSETRAQVVEEYVHCNYGYEDIYDGYYIHEVFNLKEEAYMGTIYGPSYNSELLILTNIRRK